MAYLCNAKLIMVSPCRKSVGHRSQHVGRYFFALMTSKYYGYPSVHLDASAATMMSLAAERVAVLIFHPAKLIIV